MTWVSACASSNCVQVRRVGDTIEVRDSKLGERSPVARCSLYDWSEWSRWLVSGSGPSFWVWLGFCQMYFDPDEKRAFVAAVRAGQFDSLSAEWQTAEPSSEPSSNVDPGVGSPEPSAPAERDSGRVSGLVVSDDHPAVQAVRAALIRLGIDGGYDDGCGGWCEDEENLQRIASGVAAEAVRWLDMWLAEGNHYDSLRQLAEDIDPPKETR